MLVRCEVEIFLSAYTTWVQSSFIHFCRLLSIFYNLNIVFRIFHKYTYCVFWHDSCTFCTDFLPAVTITWGNQMPNIYAHVQKLNLCIKILNNEIHNLLIGCRSHAVYESLFVSCQKQRGIFALYSTFILSPHNL